MARILTGIQSTGIPHLGNILGAIRPMVQYSNRQENESFAFIADLHSLTTIRSAEERIANVTAVAATWLACGFDHEKNTIYRQSDVPEVTELTWYLSCFAPYPMLANAHSFKDKSSRLSEVNAGLFTYPVLMAADILGYDINVVPVGKDQVQHIEITRDLAGAFNRQYGETLVVPEASVDEEVKIIPGTDGQKMSKSYHNTINVFLPEKELLKTIKGIVTDATPLEEPKNPDTCNVYNIYKVMATADQRESMRAKYLAGGYGYGHAKQELYEQVLAYFAAERERYNFYMQNPEALDRVLLEGAAKARKVISGVLGRVRAKAGFRSPSSLF